MLNVGESSNSGAIVTSAQESELRQRRVEPMLRDSANNEVTRQLHGRPRAIPLRPYQPWSSWLMELVSLPFHFTFSTISSVLRFLAMLVFPATQSAVDSIGDVVEFISRFEAQYGEQHPQFLRGSYEDALNKAKRDLRFLLVYLHSQDHSSTERFCRDCLCSSGFIDYVNENMIFWGCDANSREGYRVSQVMQEATYPFLALLCLQDSRMMIVDRLEAAQMTVDEVMACLIRAVDNNEPSLIAARSDRQQRSASIALREQQDKAYLESLRQDQEKERRQQEEQQRIKEEEEAMQKKQQQLQDMQESLARQREEKKRNLPPEPETGATDSTKVLLRLPDGRRLERRFAQTDSLQVLYDYVFCSDESLQKFVLVSSYPRKELRIEPSSTIPTLEEAGLIPSASLFVQYESDDAESD